MKKNIELEKRLREKILKDGIMDEEGMNFFINKIFEICPQELEQNVWEWVEDKEKYTDIKYYGLSINDIFNLGYDKNQFFRAMDVLNEINITLNGKWNRGSIYTLYSTSSYRS